jgi:hypothetical protein
MSWWLAPPMPLPSCFDEYGDARVMAAVDDRFDPGDLHRPGAGPGLAADDDPADVVGEPAIAAPPGCTVVGDGGCQLVGRVGPDGPVVELATSRLRAAQVDGAEERFDRQEPHGGRGGTEALGASWRRPSSRRSHPARRWGAAMAIARWRRPGRRRSTAGTTCWG